MGPQGFRFGVWGIPANPGMGSQEKGQAVAFIDPWFPSSKTCSKCGHVLEELDLTTRQWRCSSCSSLNDRDENAATNIKIVRASTIGLGDVRRAEPAIPV